MQQMVPLAFPEHLTECAAQHIFTAQAVEVHTHPDRFKQYDSSQKSLQPGTETVKR